MFTRVQRSFLTYRLIWLISKYQIIGYWFSKSSSETRRFCIQRFSHIPEIKKHCWRFKVSKRQQVQVKVSEKDFKLSSHRKSFLIEQRAINFVHQSYYCEKKKGAPMKARLLVLWTESDMNYFCNKCSLTHVQRPFLTYRLIWLIEIPN